jgi:hypothetical protein
MNIETTIFHDLDGVFFYGPEPKDAFVKLLYGRANAQVINEEIRPPKGRLSILLHKYRPFRKDALVGAQILKKAAETFDIPLDFAVLSGRTPELHQLTTEKLERQGLMDYFSEVYLNPGMSSWSWKYKTVRARVEADHKVIHIDDDLLAGLSVLRINDEFLDEPKVMVYILKNLSNHSLLRKIRGYQPPPFLYFKNSFCEVATDIIEQMQNRQSAP